ncbi:MAG: outer membrane beta-barrel protein [Ginsengibacter sp.]
MEQNNFEKNVKAKLGDLRVIPTDAVWINVEKRIAKKHTRRKVLLAFSLISLLIISAGIWLFSLKQDNNQKQQGNSVLINRAKTIGPVGIQQNEYDSSLKTSLSSGKKSPREDSVFTVTDNLKNKVFAPSTTNRPEGRYRETDKKQKKDLGAVAFTPKEKTSFSPSSESLKQQEENKNILNNHLVPLTEEIGSSNDIHKKIHNDSLSKQQKTGIISEGILVKQDVAVRKDLTKRISQNHKEHHWMFGVAFSGGKSLIGRGLLELKNNIGDNYLQNNPGIGNSGSSGNSPVATPTRLQNGIAFSGGVFTEKNISAKYKLSLGVGYRYFSLINTIGTPVGSSLGSYNATNAVNTYRNNFHYLELPLSVTLQLGKSKTLPLYWQAGINISQLISSNALQFQDNSGLYYRDNSLFNKTQLGFHTGISITLFSKGAIPVSIGPYYYYGATKLSGKGLYQNKHFNFIGIRSEILFRRK